MSIEYSIYYHEKKKGLTVTYIQILMHLKVQVNFPRDVMYILKSVRKKVNLDISLANGHNI